MTKRIKRLCKWLTGLLLVAVAWLAYVAWDIVQFGRLDEKRKCDVAIVLGAAAWDRRPSPVLEERLNHAIDLYRQHWVQKLLFTGGFGHGAPMAESEVARDYALREGVPAADILVETTSTSTVENIAEAKRLMAAHHLHSAIVVSDPLQMRRAIEMAQDEGIEAASSPTPTTRYRSKDKKADFLWEEVYKRHIYWLAGR